MIYTNAGLKLSMQSAIAAAVAISAATNATPGVFTSAAHGLLDGDVIYIEASGMIEIHGRMFVVVNKATDTFQLKNTATGAVGIDTTNFGVFSSGTFQKVTMGTTVQGCQDFTANGGAIKYADATTVGDLIDKQVVVGVSAMAYDLTIQWDPSDSGQIAMQAAFTTRSPRGFRITWPNGRYVMFYGSVGFSGMPGGGKQGITTSPAAIAMNGAPTYGIP